MDVRTRVPPQTGFFPAGFFPASFPRLAFSQPARGERGGKPSPPGRGLGSVARCLSGREAPSLCFHTDEECRPCDEWDRRTGGINRYEPDGLDERE